MVKVIFPIHILVVFYFFQDDGINNDSHGNIDVAFKKINKNFADFLIWRIEVKLLFSLYIVT